MPCSVLNPSVSYHRYHDNRPLAACLVMHDLLTHAPSKAPMFRLLILCYSFKWKHRDIIEVFRRLANAPRTKSCDPQHHLLVSTSQCTLAVPSIQSARLAFSRSVPLEFFSDEQHVVHPCTHQIICLPHNLVRGKALTIRKTSATRTVPSAAFRRAVPAFVQEEAEIGRHRATMSLAYVSRTTLNDMCPTFCPLDQVIIISAARDW